MQVSGFADTLHRKPSSDHPVYRPATNSIVSPSIIPASARGNMTDACKTRLPTAAPAATNASAAGTGNPIASANTTAAITTYPCREIKETISVMLGIRLAGFREPVQRPPAPEKPESQCRFPQSNRTSCRLGRGAMSRLESLSRRAINLPGRPAGLPFSDAFLIGDTLYISGRIGIDPVTGQAPADLDA